MPHPRFLLLSSESVIVLRTMLSHDGLHQQSHMVTDVVPHLLHRVTQKRAHALVNKLIKGICLKRVRYLLWRQCFANLRCECWKRGIKERQYLCLSRQQPHTATLNIFDDLLVNLLDFLPCGDRGQGDTIVTR